MRVLVYNWVQFDVRGEGGGVSVYLRQTIPALVRKHGWDITFLSSGRAYDPLNRSCRHRATCNDLEHLGVRSFEIVNSPIKAPAHDSVAILADCLDDQLSAETFLKVMEATGPYDAVILHNVEGISTVTLEWIKERTDAALILFLHNYHLVCPQIELLRDSRKHCEDFHDGKDCTGCFGQVIDTRQAKMARALIEVMDRTRISGTALEPAIRSTAVHGYGWARDVASCARTLVRGHGERGEGDTEPGWRRSMEALDDSIVALNNWSGDFRRWRLENTARANACADAIISVSEKQRMQLTARGIDSALVTTLHLGFDCWVEPAERRRRYEAKQRADGPLRLAFLGYAIPSKGAELLIEALEEAGAWARGIELWIVCGYSDHLHRRLARLNDRLAAVRWIDGYSQDELPDLLREIDLGIIPSICFETYSITAYELTMAGVPVLLSDSVGFEELVDKLDFRFRRGDKVSLLQALERLASDRNRIGTYWDSLDRVPSLDQHLTEFLEVVTRALDRHAARKLEPARRPAEEAAVEGGNAHR